MTDAVAPKVKKLQWVIEEHDDEKPTWWTATCPTTALAYEVRITVRGKVRTRMVGQGWSDFGGSTDDAKQAAIEDYESRILSTLEASHV